ncbi:uncharacterized protein [Amphiura filiformis]|uniref:uncharacterized protein n=1 Tax=Amphiura filiformis TaxID=82378 RepID=UPI003B2240A3
MSSGKRHLPWVTPDIKRQMRKRDKLHCRARKQQNSTSWKLFRQYRNKVASRVHSAHEDYVNNVVGNSLSESPKKFWSYVKMMRTENLGIPTLRTTTKLCTTDQEKATALNSHFQSVFTQETDTCSIPQKGISPYPSISELIIGVEGVEKQLSSLNPTKACGPDEIPPRLLKTVAPELAPALCFLFQQSYDTGVVPSQWKQALVTDFSKAFDKVPHLRLSAKLEFYGIRGSTLTWINSFLNNRSQAVSVNGTHSPWGKVTSGVPQGSVLGPALFLLYINDIQEEISSSMRLFADDSIVYRDIVSPDDHQVLQKDLNELANWSSKWLMHFNVGKCAILPITNKRKTSLFDYTILGQPLARVDQHEYLGVTISSKLRWDAHCNKITQKANRTLGLIRRTLSPCSQEVKARAYQALVRPQIEYASEAWNPHTITTVDRLERVQRPAARFVFRDYRRTTSVSALINTLGWDSLHNRRLAAQLSMFYKIHYGLVNIQFPTIIQPATYFSRHDHQLKFKLPEATIDSYKFSFYPRTVRLWNHLPTPAVLAPSLPAFQEVSLPAIQQMRLPVGAKLL